MAKGLRSYKYSPHFLMDLKECAAPLDSNIKQTIQNMGIIHEKSQTRESKFELTIARQTPAKKMDKAPVEMKKPPIPQKKKKTYCVLCRKPHFKHEALLHVHSMLHHRELEIMLGRDSFHECQACKVSPMGLKEYAQHISTAQHKAKLKKLTYKRSVKPIPLHKIVKPEILAKIHQRNKMLSNARKKADKKKKKKMKQEAAQAKKSKQVEVKTSRQPTKLLQNGSCKILAQNKENRMSGRLGRLHPCNSTTQCNHGAEQTVRSGEPQVQHPHVQTLSNQLAHLQRDDCNSYQPNRLDFRKQYSKGKDMGCQADQFYQKPWNTQEGGTLEDYSSWYSSVTEKDFTSDQLPLTGAISFISCQEESKESSSQPDPGHSPRSSSTLLPAPTVKLADRSSSDVDVNVMLRQIRRALGVREPCRADREARSLRRRTEAGIQSEAHSSVAQARGEEDGPSGSSFRDKRTELVTSPHISKANDDKGSVNKSARTSSLQSLEASTTVPTLTKQRALKKAREKTPHSEVSSQVVSYQNAQSNGKERESQGANLGKCSVNKSAKTPSLQSLQASTAVPKKPKERGLKKKHVNAQQSEEVVYHSDAQSNGMERESQGESAVPRLGTLALPASLSRHVGKTTSAEPNLNTARRIRNVGKSRKGEGDMEDDKARLKPTIQKLLCSAGSQKKVNWREMYQEAHKKKQEKVKGMPRFGIELVNPLADQEGLTQLEDEDLPLSEGFQWECDSPFPDDDPPSAPPCPHPPPPHTTTTTNDSITESQSESRIKDTEQPGTTPGDGRSSRTMAGVSVKMEAYLEEDQFGRSVGDYSSGSNVRRKEKKRKADGEMVGLASLDQSGKKKKTKSKNDQTQVDQLLAVSLKEEELNRSLQNVDSSLIQARIALQAAYAEVQRLDLLKQQFTTEVNNLRAKRIEILQGMQDGFAGASSVGENESTMPMETAVNVPQRPPSLPLSNPYPTSSILPPATTTSISHPHLTSSVRTNVSVKQESYERHIEEPASQPTKAVPPNDTARQLPSNQVIHLDPTVLQPTSLPTLSNSASPALSTSVVAESSTSSLLLSDSSKKQLEQEIGERLKNRRSELNEMQSRVMSEREKQQLTFKGRESTGDGVALSAAPERGQGQPAAVQDTDGEDDSDSDRSLEMVEPSTESNLGIIDIDDSDNESVSDTASNVSAHPGPPQKTPGVEVTFASTQTLKFKEDKTNSEIEVPCASMKNPKIPPDAAEDEEPTMGTFQSHTAPVTGLQVHGGLLYTCSEDNTARAYSLKSRELQAVFEGHSKTVNCLLVSSPPNLPSRLYTGSSDQTIRCYSIKTMKCLEKISLTQRVLCLYIGWNILYVGLTNGSVVSFDIKNLKELDVFECHGSRAVSCLASAQEGARRLLLVGSYDGTISVRDAKSGLLLRSLAGHTKTVTCMKVVNDLVFSGSSDKSVHAHNIHTGELVRIYKGHGHSVTSLAILGKVMVTACLDKLVRVYELQSHDRLQVYGGHSGMVLCMAIHKSMIYTGCYDGSVQAVKLNLMRNHRCWWHGCALIFGMVEHLVQHLLGDHSNPHQQTAKCRWRGCDTFFATRDSIRLEISEHMRHHAENDSRLES